ncbi:MAG: hypothetical protein HC905_29785 [Bacteroidales bacterium]|nr:hypothetical protein [Bacteroidales bacterium]
MKTKILNLVFLSLISLNTIGQTFTIGQSVTGQNNLMDIRGQSFKPSSQGIGSGSTGIGDTVFLQRFSVIYSTGASLDTLFLYSALPSDPQQLDNGLGGKLIGKSVRKAENDYPYTDYFFNKIPLHKDSVYYVLFRSNVNLEAGAGSSYNGGMAYRNISDAFQSNTYLDLKFTAVFSTQRNITWYKQKSPYFVKSHLTIPDSATLTIEPGVTVYFENSSSLKVQGTLSAKGTDGDTIRFKTQTGVWGGITFWNGTGSENIMGDNDSSYLLHCEITNVINGNNGALQIRDFNRIRISNCYIHHCKSNCGGAIGYYHSNTDLRYCRIENNTSTSSGGGLWLSGTLGGNKGIIRNCIIKNNSSGGTSGGIYSYGLSLEINNSLITNNKAVGNGGGIETIWNTLKIVNSTFCDNESSNFGGAIFNYGSVNLYNSIIWGNKAKKGSQCHNDGLNGFTFYNCVIQNGGNLSGKTNCIAYDPLLDENYIPLSGSRCIDGGISIPENDYAPDLKGNMRKAGKSVDIGPFEHAGLPENRKPFVMVDTSLNLMYNSKMEVNFQLDDPDSTNVLSFDVINRKPDLVVSGKTLTKFKGSFILETRNNRMGIDSLYFTVSDGTNSSNSGDTVLIIVNSTPENCILASDTIHKNMMWGPGLVEVNGNVFVKEGVKLTIAGGTRVVFNGPYKLIVLGNLTTLGTKNSKIEFSAADSSGFSNSSFTGWRGISMQNKNGQDTSVFRYCTFSYVNNFSSNINEESAVYISNGSYTLMSNCVFRNNESVYVAGLQINKAKDVDVDSCLFHNNMGQNTAALSSEARINILNSVFSKNYSESYGTVTLDGKWAMVANCLFQENSGDPSYVEGTGICTRADTVRILNTVFYKNRSAFGIISAWGDSLLDIVNCSFINNIGTRYRTSIYSHWTKAKVRNTVFGILTMIMNLIVTT